MPWEREKNQISRVDTVYFLNLAFIQNLGDTKKQESMGHIQKKKDRNSPGVEGVGQMWYLLDKDF